MKYLVDEPIERFPAWSGGKDTLEELLKYDMDVQYVDDLISDTFCDVYPTQTEVNDFLWFERDSIAQIYGYDTYDDLMFFELTSKDGFERCEEYIIKAIENSGHTGITVDAVWKMLDFYNSCYSSVDELESAIAEMVDKVYENMNVKEEE